MPPRLSSSRKAAWLKSALVYGAVLLFIAQFRWRGAETPLAADEEDALVQGNYSADESYGPAASGDDLVKVIDKPKIDLPIPVWYTPETKYLLFQPSGGISNQRKILSWALRVCQILRRTCILPHVAPHTTWYYKYNQVPIEDLASADLIYSVDQMPVPVVTLTDITMEMFARAHQDRLGGTWHVVDRSMLREKRAHPWSARDLSRMFGALQVQFLYLSKGTMWQCFNFTTAEMDPIQKGIFFHSSLRSTARELSEHITPGEGGPYNALHIRFADGEANKVRENWLKPSASFLYRMRVARFREASSYLYIATVPSKVSSPYFKPFREAYNVSFSADLPSPIPIVEQFPAAMQSTVLGILEQLICARAAKFLGTGFSTFSEHIRTLRRFRALVVDPLVAQSPREVRYAAQITPCLSELKPC